MSGSVSTDSLRKIALPVKRRKDKVDIVRLASGNLSVDTLADSAPRKEFNELDYPFELARDKFLSHGAAHGMTKAARGFLESLALEQHTQLRLF